MSAITAYPWVELAGHLADGRMIRGQYVHLEDSAAIARWRQRFDNTDVYSSIQRYARADNDAVFICPIYFDIDAKEDLPAARVSGLGLCELLSQRLSLDVDQVEISFSGHKGFHIVVPCEVFDARASSKTLVLLKRIAEKAQTAGVQHIDSGVYTHKRLWRLPNSINRKSGLFKIPLTFKELRELSMEAIIQLAAQPRPEDYFALNYRSEPTATWYRQALACLSERPRTSEKPITQTGLFRQGWRVPPCIKAIEKARLPDGMRHDAYLQLARYYAYLGMHPEEIRERIIDIDDRYPIGDPQSIDRMVDFGWKHPAFPGCDHRVLRQYCRREGCFLARLHHHHSKDPSQ